MASNQPFQFGASAPLSSTTNEFNKRTFDQQLYAISSNLTGLNLDSNTDRRQINSPASGNKRSNKRSRNHRFNPPPGPRADEDGDVEIGGAAPRRLTAKEQRRARESAQRQEIIHRQRESIVSDFRVSSKGKRNVKTNQRSRIEHRQRTAEKRKELEADPERAERRKEALQRIYILAQEYHLTTTHKAAVKEQLKALCNELAKHTEYTTEELYNDVCQSNSVKLAERILGDAVKQRDSPKGDVALEVFKKRKTTKERKEEARRNITRPKFKHLRPTTEEKHQDNRNWKTARPLLVKLSLAIDTNDDLEIAYAYGPARKPTQNLARVLKKNYEEVLSEVVPALSLAQIAKFEKPFLDIEEASKPKEPELPDLGALNFNDVLDSLSRPWSTVTPAVRGAELPSHPVATTTFPIIPTSTLPAFNRAEIEDEL